jgi:hypothetical protein
MMKSGTLTRLFGKMADDMGQDFLYQCASPNVLALETNSCHTACGTPRNVG